MSFWGSEIIFDNKPSGFYNLYLETTNQADMLNPSSSNVEPIFEENMRRHSPYLLGVRYTPVLEFDLSLFSPDEINAKMQQMILRWLTGHNQYKRLQIIQDDMTDMTFNCLITNPQTRKVGNVIYGFTFHVVCDSQWAWSFEKTINRIFTSAPNNYAINYYNKTDQEGYLYPTITVLMNNSGGSFSIVNQSESNRAFSFTSLTRNETICINNDNKIIKSTIDGEDSGYLRIGNFNKKWFRLLPGNNNLLVSGNISTLNISFTIPRKIG